MDHGYKYYQRRRFENIFYAIDENRNVYFIDTNRRNFDFWQRITWKEKIELAWGYINDNNEVRMANEADLITTGISLIKTGQVKDQPPYEYYQDIEEDWIYYARDAEFNCFIYRDHQTHVYKMEPPNRWEKIAEMDFISYCRKNMSLRSQSDPRTEEYLKQKGIPLLNVDDAIECKDYHLYT